MHNPTAVCDRCRYLHSVLFWYLAYPVPKSHMSSISSLVRGSWQGKISHPEGPNLHSVFRLQLQDGIVGIVLSDWKQVDYPFWDREL
jgi:hypothetical protein